MTTKTKPKRRTAKKKSKPKKKYKVTSTVGHTRFELVTCMRKGCPFVAFDPAGSYDQVRMAGRRHVEDTGHTVEANIVRTITWKKAR